MEGKEGTAAGLRAVVVESFQSPLLSASAMPGTARMENPSQGGVISPNSQAAGPTALPQQQQQPAPATTPSSGPAFGPGSLSVGMQIKKKRGRPRKYAPDGSLLPLNPRPISSSMLPGEYSAPPVISMKRGRGRPSGFFTKHQPRIELESLGEMVAYSAGANFTPHVITVPSGEDVTMKIISFSQQGPRAICILSANGVISNVTLRQPDSSGGTLTYEGRFELLSLSGSFMPNENGGTRSRSGGMSVSLASPDGRVVGGGVAGLLVAASPVQVVVGSFLPSYQFEQKTKKPQSDPPPISTTTAAMPISTMEMEESYGGGGQGQQSSSTPKPILATSSSLRGENWSASIHSSVIEARNSTTDINISPPGG
ncbi:hypothetical protein HPP92_014518 [Vanilla planifolia]|uniref:AT-hook motif nuclear-localized protein n=1 Tax=Vanilla planifolia TaxID=51239 RepID=A0A835URK6_VANPL|nr:hypothetical protein HPP92_014951 [Vanilla planifolia]KAG0474832.1 hypothetical protein HPP92_014518 [Vanilla planifolia]